jgi:hypothetical protein
LATKLRSPADGNHVGKQVMQVLRQPLVSNDCMRDSAAATRTYWRTAAAPTDGVARAVAPGQAPVPVKLLMVATVMASAIRSQPM